MDLFTNDRVNLEILRKKAYNYRWATHDKDVIPLTAADPDFPAAQEIVEAIKSYIADGYFSYGPPQGLPEFKNAVAQWYKIKKGVNTKSEYVLPVNSAAHGLYIIAQMILQKNENAIIPDPVDFLFRKSIEHTQATVKTCAINKETACFNLEQLESLIDDKTRAIFICNPNNPLGKIIPKEHLEQLITLADKYNLWIVSDEIWSDIYFEKPFVSVASSELPSYKKIMIVSGLSKNFALAALRIGYIIAPDSFSFDMILNASGHLTTAFGIPVLSQVAGTSALTSCNYWLEDFRIHLSKMRQLTFDFIDEMPFLEKVSPDATYLAFPKICNTDKSAAELTETILLKAKVAFVPGGINWFESKSEGHIRICYSTSEEILTQAFDRIRKHKYLLA